MDIEERPRDDSPRTTLERIRIVGLAVLIAAIVALVCSVLAAFASDWDAPKSFAVLGSAALALGALAQAWNDSSNAPKTSSGRDTLSLLSWATVSTGAIFVLIGTALG